MRASRKWLALAESAGVLALVLLYIWRLRFERPAAWAGILGLVLLSHALRGETPRRLGFRTDGFRAAARDWLLPLLAGVAAVFAFGAALGTIRSVRAERAVFNLAAYAVWGLFQQYVLNGYFVNRLVEFAGARRTAGALAGLFFSVAHAPNWFLMLVTLAGGYLCALNYLRHRNLFFLGLAHAIAGFALYMVVPDSVSRHLYVGPRWFEAR